MPSMSNASRSVTGWYARPVFFVTDLARSLRFYIDMLGFEKRWHEGDGAGTVCQIDRAGCEIILAQDPARTGTSRLFLSLTPEDVVKLQREIAARAIPSKDAWWGYHVIQIEDPDGNELLFSNPAPSERSG